MKEYQKDAEIIIKGNGKNKYLGIDLSGHADIEQK